MGWKKSNCSLELTNQYIQKDTAYETIKNNFSSPYWYGRSCKSPSTETKRTMKKDMFNFKHNLTKNIGEIKKSVGESFTNGKLF